MLRAVDKLITLMTKICRRLSVIEQGDLLWNSLIHWSQTSEKICAAAQKMSKSGLSWSDKESRFSLTVKQIFESTYSRPITTEVFKSWNETIESQKKNFVVRSSIQTLNGVIEAQRGEINRALAGDEQLRRDQQLLHETIIGTKLGSP